MTRASKRKHFVAAAMVVVLGALSVGTLFVTQELKSRGISVEFMVRDEYSEFEPLNQSELTKYLRLEVDDRPGFDGELDGIRIRPGRAAGEDVSIDCRIGESKLLMGEAAVQFFPDAGEMAIRPSDLPAGLTSLTAVVRRCSETTSVASWTFFVPNGTRNTHDGDSQVLIRRERDTNVVYHAAPRGHWFPYPVEGVLSVATNHDLDSRGCFAAALDESTGVLTSVSAWNGNSSFCVDILRAVVAK